VPTSLEICSKSPLGIVLPPLLEVYFWYDAFASFGSIAMCPSDNPPAIEPHHVGAGKDLTLVGGNRCSKGFSYFSFLGTHAILSPGIERP
jgi:hypothetical protein